MRHLEALRTDVWLALDTKVALVGAVGRNDVVFNIQDDRWAIIVFKVRRQRLNIRLVRRDHMGAHQFVIQG
jgi:hypothetical protein